MFDGLMPGEDVFLSCLGGSEQMMRLFIFERLFLSCLGGSELELITVKCLIVKEHSPKESATPFHRKRR